MKKILLLIGALMMTTCWLVGCDDNDGFSNPHILTNDELEEMERQRIQDSINRARINADIVLEYTVELNEGDAYEGKPLDVDWKAVADCFGTTPETLWAALEDGDAKPLFIQGSNHADYAGGITANGIIAYWCNREGDVCSWGSDAAVFIEWYGPTDDEDNLFYVGQMDGSGLTPDDAVTIMPGVKYQDKRAVFKITFTIKAAQKVEAGVVHEQNLTIDLGVGSGDQYQPTALAFDYNAVLAAIGASVLTTDMLVTYDANGEFVTKQNADFGFWMSKEGPIGGWGENASAWLSYGAIEEANVVGVCLMPGAQQEGDVFRNSIGFMNGNKIAMLNITINVVNYTDPETKPGTEPADIAKDIELTKVWSDDYASVDVNVKDDICKAFNMTTFELYNALNDKSLKVFINAVAEETAYTGSEPGEYWVNGEGATTDWAGGYFYTGLYIDYQNLIVTIGAGNHPENCPKPFTLAYKLIVTNGTTTATFNVTANFTAE